MNIVLVVDDGGDSSVREYLFGVEDRLRKRINPFFGGGGVVLDDSTTALFLEAPVVLLRFGFFFGATFALIGLMWSISSWFFWLLTVVLLLSGLWFSRWPYYGVMKFFVWWYADGPIRLVSTDEAFVKYFLSKQKRRKSYGTR